MTDTTTLAVPSADDLGADPPWGMAVAAVIADDLGMAEVADKCRAAFAAERLAAEAEELAHRADVTAREAPEARRIRTLDAVTAGGLPALDFCDELAASEAHAQRARDVRGCAAALAAAAFEPLTGDDDKMLATAYALAERGWFRAQEKMLHLRVLRFERLWHDGYMASLGENATELERLLGARHANPTDRARQFTQSVLLGPRLVVDGIPFPQ